MRRILESFVFVALAALVTGCGEDEVSVNPPAVVNGGVTCKCIGGAYVLDTAFFVVEDLDGPDTLGAPTATVLANSLGLSASANEETRRVTYNWDRDTGGEEIFCGDAGDDLEVSFSVKDADGFTAAAELPAEPDCPEL